MRVDTFAHEGCEISPYYDSMIAKLMTHGRDRAEAIARMKRCLDVMVVEGIKTNIPLHRQDPGRPRLRGRALRHAASWSASCPEEGRRGLVSEGAARATSSRFERLLPLLLVPVAFLSDPGAALPLRSYYFRDFGTAFYPLRLFQARELAAGRLPTWNPYVFEGTFLAPGPALYPLDLLQALRPAPAFVSWLLTLHLPLAALGAYWLARQLSASRVGAFGAGAVYALSGFTLSSLNLYVFLQALALAPFVAGLLRRAALHGGRSVVWAAAAVALGLSTYTVEFVGQAVLLGIALGLAERAPRVALATPGRRLGARRRPGRRADRARGRHPGRDRPRCRASPATWRSPTPWRRWCCCRHCSPTSSGFPRCRPRPSGAGASSARDCRTS